MEDRETKARAIAAEAKAQRKRPSRWTWIVAGIVSVVCVGGLVIAWIHDRDAPSTGQLPTGSHVDQSSGLGIGITVGIGIGILIGSVLAARK